jgi:16S rRNA (cytosine967-C5)-methyltransferase
VKAGRPNNARLASLNAVSDVLEQGRNLGENPAVWAGLDGRDTAFAKRLAFGVLRWLGSLEWLAGQLLDRPLKSKDRDIQGLVLLGLYQLWREDTSPHAAVNETAGCARQLGKPWAVGLVNAVLRRFQRERESLLEQLAAGDQQYAHPAWLLARLQGDWPENWQQIVDANNRQAPFWVRCNLARTTRELMAEQITGQQLQADAHHSATAALDVRPPVPVDTLPGFSEGLVSVQDAAAQLAAPLLDTQPGQRVLDACAAPGGKTCNLLELNPGLDLTALDLKPSRMALIRENLDRLGLEAQLLTADATKPDEWWDGQLYQRILLDAPCSATGVIRRHPEIKWLRDASQVEEVTALQRILLTKLWPLLDVGGIFVYATCSVLKQENCQQIHEFLENHANAECVGPDSGPGLEQEYGRQIFPGEEGMDGFYYAVLRKSA